MKKYLIPVLFTAFLSCEKTELPRCNDGILNGDETGIDCGGSCEVCYTCSDGIKNQFETETDCGGECAPCFGEWVGNNTTIPTGINEMHFFNETTGYVWDSRIGDGFYGVFKTGDGGKTWSQVALPSSDFLVSFVPVAEDRLFAQFSVGFDAYLMKSSNGGQSWQMAPTGAALPNYPCLISFHDLQNGIMTVQGATANSWATIFFKTANGGSTWEQRGTSFDLVPEVILNDSIICNNLTAFGNGTAYAYSPGWRFISQDYGASWSAVPNTAIAYAGTLKWANPQTGIMKGRPVNTPHDYAQRDYYLTTDGGQTWNKKFSIEHGFPQYTEFYFKGPGQLIG
jgi:photosystem II stability/assembly factor-like uncharacterized protein